MNTQFYNQLLNHAQSLIYRFPFLPLQKEDLVHENWDFKTMDKTTIVKKINKYFYGELKKHHVPFSRFKYADGNIIAPELIKGKLNIQDAQRHCKKCKQVLPKEMFTQERHICKDCYRPRGTYLKRRSRAKDKAKVLLNKLRNGIAELEISMLNEFSRKRKTKIERQKAYNKTERGKQVRRKTYLKNRDKNLEKRRKQGRESYQRRKEKIIAKTKEMRKLGIWKDRTAHERYLRYKNKMLLKKATAVRQ